MALGKAAANKQAVNVRQVCIGKRVEWHQFCAGTCECIKIIRVVKTKGGITCDADLYCGAVSRCVKLLRGKGQWFRCSRGKQLIQINLVFDEVADFPDLVDSARVLIAGYKPQVPFDNFRAIRERL